MMTDEQFAQLLSRVGGGKQLPAFKSGDPTEWIAWRRTFLNVKGLKNWNDNAAKKQLVAAMEETACRMVADIDVGATKTWQDVLTDYGNRFLPAAASRLARQEFKAARQKYDETILQWHTRVRELFIRAHPTLDVEDSAELVEAFLLGLSNPEVRRLASHEQPASMAAALTSATNKAAVAQSLRVHDNMRGDRAHVGALQQPRFRHQDGPGCWDCGDTSHFRRDCPRPRTGRPPWRGHNRTPSSGNWRRQGIGFNGPNRSQNSGSPTGGQKGISTISDAAINMISSAVAEAIQGSPEHEAQGN